MQLAVELDIASEDAEPPPAAAFRRWAQAALAVEPGLPADQTITVHIRITDETESAALNHQFRGKNKPTNVLSFPVSEPVEDNHFLLGDLVLCAPVILREASDQSKQATHHWAHMVVHGTLHLVGYDHIEAADAQRMEAREVNILAELGMPDPYQTPIEQPTSIHPKAII